VSDAEGQRLLQDTQKALLNILEDLHQSNEELQRAHDVLELRVQERTAELARSNAELEQFAYIASHDLQEPLRMVSSYVQLLERRYKGKLDRDADEFIGFAAEGAIRMQRLINDLLAYSRVGTRGKSFEEVDLEAALARALENLQLAVAEKRAVITRDPLPAAFGDNGQLTQVFQNLIDNALKFSGGKQPRVHISARLAEGDAVCSIQDNGIGIAPEFLDRLFLLFQRLHTRKEYPGTGLGLAICKRIVERHGGSIWVESEPERGSTFYFRIPTSRRSH
jgi:light-regulated signal transduction histidine kinase (bacteriophytochrome)